MNLTAFSKLISYALRHAPEEFGLSPDPEGWVPVPNLLAAVRRHPKGFPEASVDHLEQVLREIPKKRWEMDQGRIRALYGHSMDQKIRMSPSEPPEILLHGTTPEAEAVIREKGILPMSRQYVHLSTESQTAAEVAGRRTGNAVLLRIRAKEAHEKGIRFFFRNQDTWLSEPIPPQFIDFPNA